MIVAETRQLVTLLYTMLCRNLKEQKKHSTGNNPRWVGRIPNSVLTLQNTSTKLVTL
jgi:hypothetical protein